jgi:hypothetical protein
MTHKGTALAVPFLLFNIFNLVLTIDKAIKIINIKI